MTPEIKAARGAKRKCQNEACALPFYDLNRDPILCPNCQSSYVIQPVAPPTTRYGRPAGRSERPIVQTLEPASAEEISDELPVAEEAAAIEDESEPILEVDDEDDELQIEVENDNKKDD